MNPFLSFISSSISGLVSPITNHFTKKNDNKTKIKLQQIERLKNSDDSLAEWESIQAEGANSSWKDEWITLIITLPIPVIFVSVILSVLLDDPLIAEAAKDGVTALKELVPNYDELLYIVCLAAIGIKAFKR
jgi:hypothetical protein